MKKNFTKKLLAAFAVAMLFAGLTQAQILTDYVQSTGSEAIDTVTVSSTTRLYAYPDAVFSPSYNATTNAGRGSNQRWTWYNGTDATGTEIKPASNDNWIEFTWPGTAQTYPVAVVESNSAVSCNGSATTINVEVIASPTVTFNTTDGTPVFYGTTGVPVSICESDARVGTDYFQATVSHGIADNNDSRIQLHYKIIVDTSNDAGSTWTNIVADSGLYYNGTQVTTLTAPGVSHNLAVPPNTGSGTSGFVAINGAMTRYTYSLIGVTDKISRKSDYDGSILPGALTGWTLYDTTVESAAIVVNPVPVTGPIYHISNTWAN
jgi:hypothetical protein